MRAYPLVRQRSEARTLRQDPSAPYIRGPSGSDGCINLHLHRGSQFSDEQHPKRLYQGRAQQHVLPRNQHFLHCLRLVGDHRAEEGVWSRRTVYSAVGGLAHRRGRPSGLLVCPEAFPETEVDAPNSPRASSERRPGMGPIQRILGVAIGLGRVAILDLVQEPVSGILVQVQLRVVRCLRHRHIDLGHRHLLHS